MMIPQDREFDLLTMGEIMLRLSPPATERLVRGEVFEKRAGGSELNVASGVSLLGLRTGIISKLPDNPMGIYIKNRVRFLDVSDDCLVYDSAPGARLGLYYYESGAHPRKPSIVYDRAGSSFTRIAQNEIDPAVYGKARAFHTSGITLALGGGPRQVALQALEKFKQAGAMISFDVNYRANLWSEQEAMDTMRRVLPLVDILFVSEESSRRMFGKTGTLEDIMHSYCTEYGVKMVATTRRTVITPKTHQFTSMIYDAATDRFYSQTPYADIDVVDRIGSGDAYVAGVLFGMLRFGDPQKALEFGDAAGSVKNTIPGDLPSSDFGEISSIIRAHNATGYVSEMNR